MTRWPVQDLVDAGHTPRKADDLDNVIGELRQRAWDESCQLRAELDRPPSLPEGAISGWLVEATCADCGRMLVRVASGRPYPTGVSAMAQCSHCGRTWLFEATLTDTAEAENRERSMRQSGRRPR